MEKSGMPASMVGNEFFVPKPRIQTATPVAAAPASIPVPSSTFVRAPIFTDSAPMDYELEDIPQISRSWNMSAFSKKLDFAHKYSMGTFAVLFLLVGASATQVASNYYSKQIIANTPVMQVQRSAQPISGFNMSVPSSQFESKMQTITHQSINITMGSTVHTIEPSTIQNWMKVVNDQERGTSYIHINEKTIAAHLKSLADKTSRAPRNQVTVSHNGVDQVIVGGINGTKVSDTGAAAKTIARNLFAAKGFNEVVPTDSVAFQAVTPAAFSKLIEVNINTKQMYLYENGNLYKQYAISAGAPKTPTPIGQFKTQWKLPKQDMRGFNPNGTRYFQPNVKWISYFAPGGVAIHGVYWHGSSWFGNINSSHGCVGLPDSQAKEVYDWTPTGTTIITHM